MARRRMIAPNIWEDPWFGKLTETEQILFIGIISNCDDDGRVLGDATFLRNRIFVYKDIPVKDIENSLIKFSNTNNNFLLYEINNCKYIALKRWERYQKPDHATPSILPEPPNQIHSGNDSRNDSGNDSPPSIGKGSIGKGSIEKEIYKENLFSLVDKETCNAFLEMRKKLKKPLTEYGIKILIGRLETLKKSGNDPKLVLEQSIMNSWQGVFELKDNHNGSHQQSNKRNEPEYVSPDEIKRRAREQFEQQPSNKA